MHHEECWLPFSPSSYSIPVAVEWIAYASGCFLVGDHGKEQRDAKQQHQANRQRSGEEMAAGLDELVAGDRGRRNARCGTKAQGYTDGGCQHDQREKRNDAQKERFHLLNPSGVTPVFTFNRLFTTSNQIIM